LHGEYHKEGCPSASGSTKAGAIFQANNQLKVAGIVVDKIKTLCGVFNWNHIFWYQWLALTPDGGPLALAGPYSEREQISLSRWAGLARLGDPNRQTSIPEICDSISSPGFQRSCMESILHHVPQLAFDSNVRLVIKNLWKALIAADEIDWNEDGGFDSMFRCYMGWQPPPSYEGLSQEDALLRYTKPIRRFISIASSHRRLFISESGKLGLVPEHAREGDSACVLLGCVLPMLLRAHGEHFEVIGALYLQGSMDGEAMEEMDKGNLLKREFVLR
jgi:hypothetical protein